MSEQTKSTLLSALVGTIIGALVTGFVSLLLVGGNLHQLETKFDTKAADLGSRLSAVEASLNYLREERRIIVK